MRKALLLALALGACTAKHPEQWTRDACLQREIFTQCLARVPMGPNSPTFNDWDDVVDSCRAAAREQSTRACSTVLLECQEGGMCPRIEVTP